MNRRRFFGMLAGVIGALALPVPKQLTNADIWLVKWGRGPIAIFPVRMKAARNWLTLKPSKAIFRRDEVGSVKLSEWKA